MTEIEQAEQKRDRRLRRRILMLMNAARVRPQSGWCGGTFLLDLVDAALPPPQKFEDADHLLALLRDLVSSAYVQEGSRQGIHHRRRMIRTACAGCGCVAGGEHMVRPWSNSRTTRSARCWW